MPSDEGEVKRCTVEYQTKIEREVGNGNTITVTNNSGAAAAQVYVYYKNVSGDMLLGGITYRAGVKDLAAGESQSSYTSHFHEGASALLFVTYVP